MTEVAGENAKAHECLWRRWIECCRRESNSSAIDAAEGLDLHWGGLSDDEREAWSWSEPKHE